MGRDAGIASRQGVATRGGSVGFWEEMRASQVARVLLRGVTMPDVGIASCRDVATRGGSVGGTFMPLPHSSTLRSRHSCTMRCAVMRRRQGSLTTKSASSMNAYAVALPCACTCPGPSVSFPIGDRTLPCRTWILRVEVPFLSCASAGLP